MPAYQYKTQEGKDKHNAWRREYYRKNKERIRARDNANARKRRRENKELGITPKKYTRKKIDVRNNPDKERIREAIRAEGEDACAEELGDLLFSVVNVARFLHVSAEQSLSEACEKFIRRFQKVEELANARGVDMQSAGIDALDKLWEEAKKSQA